MSISSCSLARRLPRRLEQSSLCLLRKSVSTVTADGAKIQARRIAGATNGFKNTNTSWRSQVQSSKMNKNHPSFFAYFSSTSKTAVVEGEKMIQPEGMIEQIKYNPHLRSRFNQSLFNWIFSFSAVILAAQSLKSSKERQKVQRQLQESEILNEKRLQILQSLVLQSNKTLEPITQRILVEVLQKDQAEKTSKERNNSWWFGGSSSSLAKKQHDDNQQKHLEKAITKILREEMFRLVSEHALDEAQREVFISNMDENHDDEMNLKNLDPEQLMVGGAAATTEDLTAPAKGPLPEKRKKAFTM